MPERNIRITGLSANLGARIGFYPRQKVGKEYFLKEHVLEDFHENFLAKLLYAVCDVWHFSLAYLNNHKVFSDH